MCQPVRVIGNIDIFSTQLVGAAIFGMAAWIRFQDDFQEWIIELGMEHYWRGIWVLFASGILVMTISFFGCCGAVSENRHLLTFVSDARQFNLAKTSNNSTKKLLLSMMIASIQF